MDDIIQTYYFLIKNIFHAWHVHFFLFLLLIVIFMHLHISAYQEKRREFENNRYCFVLLFFIVSCLLRTKMINVKQIIAFMCGKFQHYRLLRSDEIWFFGSGGKRFDWANVIFAAYFILRGRDTHINFLRLLFMVGMICPLMQEHFLWPLLKSKALQCS